MGTLGPTRLCHLCSWKPHEGKCLVVISPRLAFKSEQVAGMAFSKFFTAAAIISLAILTIYVKGDLVLSSVERNVDLASQVVKVTSKLTFENDGSDSVDSVLITSGKGNQLVHVDALIKGDDEDDDIKLELAEIADLDHPEAQVFKVTLAEPLAAGKSITVDSTMVYAHALQPFPASIGQSEKQLVLFVGNHYLLSPYLAKTQTTTVKLSSATIESYSKLKPVSTSESTITYGPYKNVAAYSTSEMKIHYENNTPFLTVNEMTRWIEVSHWGNIAVEETYHMTHSGATLKGHFSRYDYQRTPTHSVIKSFKTVLPSSARDVYYRDEIGNISTSHMLVQDDSVEVELRPRFPLFGGWQTRYYMGYNVPTYEYLFSKGDRYVLKMRLVDHIFDDFVVDKLTVKVVLPEGSSNIQVKAPYAVSEGGRELHKTYLDTLGRNVVVLLKDGVVENHIQDFQVHYTFKKAMLLQEPLLCVAAFYILFITVIILVRLDFSISKDAAQESRMKVAGLFDELSSLCDRRSALLSQFDAAVDKFKTSKDSATFGNALKALNQDYTGLTGKVNGVVGVIMKEDAESQDKLLDLQKKELERKAVVDGACALASKVVSGKLSRQQYADGEQSARAKLEKLGDEIDGMLANF